MLDFLTIRITFIYCLSELHFKNNHSVQVNLVNVDGSNAVFVGEFKLGFGKLFACAVYAYNALRRRGSCRGKLDTVKGNDILDDLDILAALGGVSKEKVSNIAVLSLLIGVGGNAAVGKVGSDGTLISDKLGDHMENKLLDVEFTDGGVVLKDVPCDIANISVKYRAGA